MSNLVKNISKIIISGNGGVGKTTLMRLFCYNQYCDDQGLTIGTEFFLKKAKFNGKIIALQVWNLGGEEHFRFFLPDFLQGAAGALLGFDVKRRKSFLDLKKWVSLLRKHNPRLPIILLGLKRDLGYHPLLSYKMAKKFAKKFDLTSYIKVSSKKNLNVDLPFKHLI